jgi:hypothetical protein
MKSVVFYAALLSAAMVGSYLSWTSDETEAAVAEAVAVYRASEGDVTALVFTSEDVDVTLERKTDARGDYAAVSVTERKKKALPPEPMEAPDPEAGPDAPSAEPDAPEGDDNPEGDGADGEETPAEAPPEERFEIEVVEQSFTGSDKALALLADFEPLEAKRKLDASLATTPAFGFDEPTGTIVVKRKGQEETLVLGGSTYGSKDRYLKHDADLFLVDDTRIRPLQFAATRLRERSPQPWAEGEIETLSVSYDGKVGTFEHKNRDDRAKAYWARSGEEGADDSAAAVIERILRLKVDTKGEDPSGALEPLAEVVLTRGDEQWTVTLASDGTEEGRFLTSDYLRGTVPARASSVDEILDDLTELLAQ